MTQQRIQDFGSPVVAQSFKLLTSSFINPAVLSGFTFIVDAANRMRINPGSAITNQGIIIIENETKTLVINNTSVAADYTIYYSHVDADVSGGVSAILTMDSGLLTASVVTGVILGYVRYPGGGIPLDQSHFIQAPPLKLGSVTANPQNTPWLIPIRNQGYMVTSASGAALTLTDTWDISGSAPVMYLKIANNNLTSGTVNLTFPFKVSSVPFALLQMVISTDINALITPYFIDSVGAIVTLTTPYSGQATLSLKSVVLPRITEQDPNTIVYLQLEITLAASRTAKIQSLGLSTYNLPV